MSLIPEYLRSIETAYEILIRDGIVPASQEDKRKILRGLLEQETGNRSFTAITNPFSFKEDEKEVAWTIADLVTKIEAFKGKKGEAEHKRIICRLTHVSGRISRMSAEDEEQKETRKQLRQKVLLLEADLGSKAEVVVPPTIAGTIPPSLGAAQQAQTSPAAVLPPPSVLPASTPLAATSLQPPPLLHHTTSTPELSPNFMSPLENKKVPVYKWGLKKFSGQGSLIEFLEIVESLRISRGCSKEDLFASAGDLLEAHAWTWWHNSYKKGRFLSWEELEQGLKQTFLCDNYDRNLLDEIRAKRQGPRERASIFISSMEALLNRLTRPPPEIERVDMIKINLLPDYIKLLALQEIDTIEHLSYLCRKIEDSLQSCKSTNSTVSNVPQTYRSSGLTCAVSAGVVCWNCRETGHPYFLCHSKRTLFCYGCGARQVTKAQCRWCSKNDTAAGSVRQNATASSNTHASTPKPITKSRRGRQ